MKKILFVTFMFFLLFNSCNENITDFESPGSFKILFAAQESPGSSDMFLYTMNSDGTGKRLLRDFSRCYFPKWSPNGKYIYYGKGGTIYRMSSDGTNDQKIVDGEYYNISPLGNKVCYIDIVDRNVLNVINVDGSNPKKIFQNTRSLDLMTWSPDGNYVVITDKVNDYQKVNIYLININNASVDTLATDINLWPGINWSKDGNYLLLNRNEGIFKLEIKNKNLTALTSSNLRNLQASYSPDNNKIAYITIPAELGSWLIVIDSDGKNMRKIEDSKPGASNPRWSPGGTKICYLHNKSVKVVDPDGSNRITLFQGNKYLDYLDIVKNY